MPGRGQYIGSFQTGVRVKSETPLEEVWSRVAMHDSGDYLRTLFAPPAGEDSEPYVQYASVRLRQAVEFREATRQATLLTAPLSLYYSFLNLTRACLCLKLDMLGSGGHGLKFRKSGDLLSSAAELRGGTFTDYLREVGYSFRSGKVVSLHDALSRIIEIRTDYAEIYGRESLVIPVDVDAHFSGEVVLKIPQKIYDVSRASPDWTSELPILSGCCTVGSEGNNLEATFRVSKYEDVSSFCSLSLCFKHGEFCDGFQRDALVPPKQSSRRRRPCVVTIGSGEHHRQRSTPLIDEEVDLRPEVAPVSGIVAHFLASQRSWGVLGVHRLPLPADPAALPGIVLDHPPPPEFLQYACPSPPLETLMDDA
jgi:hypothetical protein